MPKKKKNGKIMGRTIGLYPSIYGIKKIKMIAILVSSQNRSLSEV